MASPSRADGPSLLTEPPVDAATMSAAPPSVRGFRHSIGLGSIGRRTLGISFLMVTVFLWTASNFLASYIFSDSTFSKPFFVVYVNTSVFAISLIPMSLRFLAAHGVQGTQRALAELARGLRHDVHTKLLEVRARYHRARRGGSSHSSSSIGNIEAAAAERLLVDDDDDSSSSVCLPPATAVPHHHHHHERLSLRETAWLSLEFCLLWFVANYLAVACLEHTSVASATIFTSLSSMFTLVLCAAVGVEPFSARKLVGVVASLAGVALVSTVDLTGGGGGGNDEGDDTSRGRFPYKTPAEIALGDAMALLSAAVYGVYVTVMKSRVGHEDRVDMPLFFGLVGLFNVVFLWPGFVVLHWTGIEPFVPPPSGTVWAIVIANSLSSFLSDMTWAYAMLLTTPIVVTVGLSLTIPLSLVGEMIQYDQYSSGLYWVGASIVVGSFLFINNESRDAAATTVAAAPDAPGCVDGEGDAAHEA